MNTEIPKIIWTLWFQGWENAPPVVQKCKTTWIEHNPGWTIHFLTMENLSEFIDLDTMLPGYKEKKLQPEALSNVIRLTLLIKYGGVWADSTLYCNKPLDAWLPQYASPSGFFAFANPGPDRMLSTWFLAATPNHIIAKKWYTECVAYWKNRTERHTYHWCHYLFGDLYNKDESVKNYWDKTPSISADDPHYFLPYEETLYKPISRTVKKAIDEPLIPVFKLTFRYDAQRVNSDSTIQYLLSDKATTPAKTIVIVGMHRSGTSLTASLLQKSGLNIGEDLLGAGVGNTQGHYENIDFLNFHMRMLEKSKLHPDGWDEAEIEQLDDAGLAEAKEIIEHNESSLWGWKEPRTTLFLNFWANVLPEARFLFVYRSPVEVIDSFFRRGTDAVLMEDPGKTIAVWLYYNKLVLKYYEKFKDRSLLINIKSIIHSYPESIKAINEKFNVALNPNIPALFEKQLFNERSETHILRGKLLYQNMPEVKQVYEKLLEQSWHPTGSDCRQELSLENSSDKFMKLFLNQWKDMNVGEAKLKAVFADQISQLKQEHESQIEEMKKSIREKDQIISERQGEIEWMRKTKFWKLRNVWQKVKLVIT